MRYVVVLEDEGRAFVVEGWDEVEKFKRDHASSTISLFLESAKMDQVAQDVEKASFELNNPGWRAGG